MLSATPPPNVGPVVTSGAAPGHERGGRDAHEPELEPDEGERISITDVHGTVARFEMTYSAEAGERVTFGPPLRARIPSFFYLAFSVALLALAIGGHFAPTNSALYRWIVEGDRGRPVSSLALALVAFASGVGSVLRAQMRGVIVHADGVEGRYVLMLGIPRVRRWLWAQVHRLVIDDGGVMLELWDATYARLPDVADTRRLGEMLGAIAQKRGIQVTRLEKIPRA